jgi:hypothetical protein
MANNDTWVEERMAQLAPPDNWNPDPEVALRRRERKPARLSWGLRAATACVAVAALVALPQTRALAQRAWQFLFVHQLEIVRVNFDDAPDVKSFQPHMLGKLKQTLAANREEASRKAGFEVKTPAPSVLAGAPEYSVIDPVTAELVIDTADLERALQKAGITGLHPPKDWNGAHVALHTTPIVTVDYQRLDIELLQSAPLIISAPPGFHMGNFTELALRILGLNATQARHFGSRMSTTPAWFLGIPEEDAVTIREVALKSGPGTLVRDFDDKGEFERLTLLWSTPDRLYILSAHITDELAITIANSLQ